ncbi:MAG: cytochrome c biogenesis protein CcsA, partial [Thermoguttaceae bacterium]|nr:cytochrome c biogenesis protein CcsA [Thermoguttaceae bacterium]
FTPVYEPGSSTAASFSSLTRVLPPDLKPEEQAKIVAETPENDVLIRMNRPCVVKSPQTGRTFWAYQDSFRGPFKPGDAEFDSVCGGKLLPAETTPRERLYYTIISLNSDPGRGLKYLGSLFIVWGTALLIYRKKKRAATPETSEPAASTTDNSAMKTPETLVKSVVFVAALLAGTNATLAAEAAPAAPKTAARADIDWTPWRLLPVFDGGRRQPLNTFAEILVKDVCGVKSPVIAAPEDVLKELEGDKALNFPTLEEMLQDVPEADKARQTELFREAEAAALDQQRAAAAKIRAAFPNGRRKFGSAELLFSWIVEPEIWELLPFIADDDCVVAKEALKRSPLDVAKRFGRLSPSDFELVDAKSGRTLVEQFKTAGRSGNATAALKAISAAEKRVASFRSVAYVPTQTRSSRPRVHLNKALFGEPNVGMNGFHAASPSAISRLSASAQKLERLVAYEDKEVRSSSPFFDKTFLLRERTPIPGADGKDSGRETLKLERELYAAAMVYGSRPLPVAGQIFENLYSRADDALARLRRHRDEIFAAQTFSDEYRQELQVAVGALSETVAAVEAAYLSLVEEEPKILAVAPVVRRRVFHTDESQDSPWVSLQTLLWAPDAMYARFVEPAYAPDVLGLTAAGREFPDFSDRVGPEKSAAEAAEPISPFAPFDAALTQTLEESRYRRDAARAFLAAAAAYRDKAAFDGAKVGAALQEFAGAVRALAGDSEPFRAALAEEETADEALRAQFLAKTAYPAPGDLGAEYFYYRLNPFYWNWIACLLATLALAASFVRGIWRREERLFFGLGLGFLVASCCVAFWGGAIRAYVTGWAPVTNMYETVVLLAFLIAAIAVGFALYPIWGAPFAAAWRAAGCKSFRRGAVGIPGGVVWTLFAVRAVATVACVVLTARICYAEQVFDGGLVKTIAESFAMQGILDRVAVLGTFLFVAWGVPRFLAATLGLIVFPKALFPPLVGVEFWRVGVSETIRRKTLLTASAVAALLVAASAYFNSSEFNPNIRPLVAVLRSNFWLTIHVFAIIISYALGAIAWMISLTSLADYIFGRYSAPSSAASPSAAPVSRRAAKKARRAEKAPSAPSNSAPRAVREPDYCGRVAPVIAALIRSAVLFLTVGIILGARWADFSWGRFWSWDPKEVWALVTLLIYLVVLHALRLRGGKNFGLSAGATLGALAIVTTWYGLSFVMGGGGRHAYAAGESNKVAVLYVAFALNIGWVALAFIRYAIENFRNRGAAREA